MVKRVSHGTDMPEWVLMNDLEFKTRDIEEYVLDTMENTFFSILLKIDISEPRWEKILFVF